MKSMHVSYRNTTPIRKEVSNKLMATTIIYLGRELVVQAMCLIPTHQ